MSLMQSGTFQLDSNSPSAAGKDTSTFVNVSFPSPFPASANVVVIPMVQTFVGGNTPGLRISDVTPNGFLVRMNELVSNGGPLSDGKHKEETIGYIAISV